MHELIYKIFLPEQWMDFQNRGIFEGSAHDQRDGFIHLCSGSQLAGTLEKHYAEAQSVVLAEIDAQQVSAQLKWEVSRGGKKFPHLFDALTTSALVKHIELAQTPNVGFQLPDDL
jgi:uncharacterized protein (DUF952 family)